MHRVIFEDRTERHLGRAIRQQAERNGDTCFLMFDTRRYSFHETNARVNELAEGLRRRGIGRGDRVAFFMGSAPEVMFLVLAVNKLGGIWIPVNTDYRGAWLQDTLERSRPALVITDTAHAARIAELGDSAGWPMAVLGDGGALPQAIDFDGLYVPGAGEPDLAGQSYGDTCAVLWTSGTTGRSKGVMQSHNVWFNAAFSGDDMHDTRAGDVIYNVMPMYNSGAWVTALFRAMLVGVSLAVDPAFSVHRFWDRVRFYGATQTFTLGAMHMFLWNAPPRPDDADNPLREIQAVPMPTELKEPFSRRFGVKVLGQGMSQSEAMMLIRQNTRERDSWPPGSCGNPVPFIDMRLCDDEGNDVPIGEAGELCARPKEPFAIFNGYLDDPVATAAAFHGEWYRTGDLLRRDAGDNYYFVDRKKDAVRYKGRNVSTWEVESVARKHPAVQDCAAFGIRSAELAEEDEIKLNVILREGHAPAPEEIARFINANAPYFFVPRYIEYVSELPYTPNGKVQKYRLRELGVGASSWDARAAGFQAQR